jgi:hypothetical protein
MTIDHSIPPFRDLSAERLHARKEHLMSEITRAQQRPHFISVPRLVRPRRRITALALVAGLLVVGTALAATTNWLTGSPAPKSVVSDFGSYTPQLGFNPDPGSAVLVAEDSNVSLYATTNKQGSYCLVASAPWKRPSELPDGGTCVPPAQASATLIAGLVGASSSQSDGQQTYLIAGRTTDADGRTIRFTDPNGDVITQAIGSSGFFIAAVHTTLPACAQGDWNPIFSVLGADGSELNRATITLAFTNPNTPGVCGFAAPHS